MLEKFVGLGILLSVLKLVLDAEDSELLRWSFNNQVLVQSTADMNLEIAFVLVATCLESTDFQADIALLAAINLKVFNATLILPAIMQSKTACVVELNPGMK